MMRYHVRLQYRVLFTICWMWGLSLFTDFWQQDRLIPGIICASLAVGAVFGYLLVNDA